MIPLLLAGLLASAPSWAGTVSGAVEGFPDGEPLAGVPVRVMGPLGRTVEGISGLDGRFEIADVPEGWHRAQARPLDGHLPSWFPDTYSFCGSERFRVPAAGEVTDLRFRLPAGGSLEGVVRGPAGAPLAGVEVTARGLDFYDQDLRRSDTTDPGGRYRLDGLDSISIDGVPFDGQYELSAVGPGGARWYWPGTWTAADGEPVGAARGELRVRDLAFAAPSALEGRVLDSTGPVEGAWVRVVVAGAARLPGAFTGPDGVYRLDELEADAVGLLVTSAGHAPGSLSAEEGPIELLPGAASHAPDVRLLPGAALRLTFVLPEVPSRLSVRSVPGGATLASRSVSGAGELVLEDLPEGDAELVLVALDPLGPAPTPPSPIALTAGEEAEAELRAEAGAAIALRVRGRGSRDLLGARLEVLDPATGEVLGSGEGGAPLGPLRPGPALIRASWAPYCASDPAWVDRWLPGARRIEGAEPVDLLGGELLELGAVDLPPDGDADGMDDVWELLWGLDPSRPDGEADPDGDGASNLEEYRQGSDPRDRPAPVDCAGGAGGGLLLLLALTKRGQRGG